MISLFISKETAARGARGLLAFVVIGALALASASPALAASPPDEPVGGDSEGQSDVGPGQLGQALSGLTPSTGEASEDGAPSIGALLSQTLAPLSASLIPQIEPPLPDEAPDSEPSPAFLDDDPAEVPDVGSTLSSIGSTLSPILPPETDANPYIGRRGRSGRPISRTGAFSGSGSGSAFIGSGCCRARRAGSGR